MVHGSLGEHGVVLKLTLAERGSVGRDDDQLGLAGLYGRFVSGLFVLSLYRSVDGSSS